MARSEREYEILRRAEKALESDSLQETRESLLDLLNTYQRLSRRVDKILKSSDKQQDTLLKINEKLQDLRDEQQKNISELIEDKKKRAKNILDSKRKIFEAHQKEINEARSSVDELTVILLEKDKVVKRYELLEAEYKKLKASQPKESKDEAKEYSRYEYEDAIEKLNVNNALSEEIISGTKKLLESELFNGSMDNIKFSKNFLKMLKNSIKDHFLSRYQTEIPHDKLSVYIIKYFAEDILSVVADTIMEKGAKKVRNAMSFLNFYNGEVTFDNNGQKYKKPEIIDRNGNRWITSTITQIVLQRATLLKQIEDKKEIIRNSMLKYNNDMDEIARCESKISALNVEFESTKLSADSAFGKLKEYKDEYLVLKTKLQKAPDDAELAEKCTALKASIDELEHNDEVSIHSKKDIKKEQEELEAKLIDLKKDTENYKKMLANEKGKLILLEENYAPLEEKHDLIITALSKAMLSFINQK